MEIKKISLSMEAAYNDFAAEWAENKEDIVPFSARLQDNSFAEFVEKAKMIETVAPEGFVCATTFYLTDNEEIIGAINIRHSLNEYLENFGGHIGYGVKPSKRGMGYAKVMYDMTVPFLKELSLDKVLITCDFDNYASAKTIENCGGVLENQIVNDEGVLTNRYWVEVR